MMLYATTCLLNTYSEIKEEKCICIYDYESLGVNVALIICINTHPFNSFI